MTSFYLVHRTWLLFTFLLLTFTLKSNAQQWTLVGSVSGPGNEPSISVVDANTVFVAGGAPDTPRVFLTVNGGTSWTQIPTTGIAKEIYCVWGINSTTLFAGEGVVNGNARLFKTTNSGATWNVEVTTGGNQGYFNGLVFSRINPQIGGALAEKLYLTTNGGTTWAEINPGVSGVSSTQNSFLIVDASFFGFGLNNGASRVRVSTNGGGVWNTQGVNLTGSYTSGFTYKEDKFTGLAATSASMPLISRTTDGGTTWLPITVGTGPSGITLMKWVPGTNVVYLIGSNGTVKRSADNGLTWTSMTTPSVTGINHFDFVMSNNIIYGYAVSSTGDVMKVADSLLLTGVNQSGSEIPSQYELFQNYPNPFNPSTKIKFSIPADANVKLLVYDITGRLAADLVNEPLKSGSYEINFDASGLASGMYYYKIQAGEFTDTKKMMLIK